jgi:hypothetical protein
LTLSTDDSRLFLPVRLPRAEDGLVQFEPPTAGQAAPVTPVSPARNRRETRFDWLTGISTYTSEGEGGLFGEGVVRFDDIGTMLNHSLRRELTIEKDDPLSASYAIEQSYVLSRDDWDIRIETRTQMTATSQQFRLSGTLRALKHGKEVGSRVWSEAIDRDLV